MTLNTHVQKKDMDNVCVDVCLCVNEWVFVDWIYPVKVKVYLITLFYEWERTWIVIVSNLTTMLMFVFSNAFGKCSAMTMSIYNAEILGKPIGWLRK